MLTKITLNGLLGFLKWFASPSAAIQEPQERRRAQLLILLLMVMLSLGLVINVLYEVLVRETDPVRDWAAWLDSLGGLIILIGCLVLSRSRHYRWAALLTIVAMTLMIAFYASAWNVVQNELVGGDIGLLLFLLIPILLASVLLDGRLMIGTIIFVLAVGFLAAVTFSEEAFYDVLLGEIGYLFLITSLLLVISQWDLLVRSEQQAALIASENRYQLLVELSPDAIVVYDQHQVLYANPAAARIMGVASPADLIGKPIRGFVFEDSPVRAEERLQVWMGQESVRYLAEERLRTPDGRLLVVEASTTPVVYQGQPARQVIARDITARKLAELERLRIYKAIEGTSDFICITDEVGKATYINSAFVRQLGYTLEDLSSYAAVLRMYVDRKLGASIGRHLLDDQTWQGEVELRAKDGRKMTIFIRADRIKDEYEQVIGSIAVGTDITERKQIDLERAELQRDQALVQARQEFISGISHDLKSPLTIMFLRADLLERTSLNPHQRKDLEVLRLQMLRMRDFIDDLLIINRLEETDSSLNFKIMDVNEIIKALVEELQPFAEDKGISLQQELASDLPALLVDRMELKRAIGNLVDNALRYTEASGSVKIRTLLDGECVLCEIQDTGIGISPDDLGHIFDRFFRAAEARSNQPVGTGLGLAISQKIVEAHNGKIEVSSQRGQGSLFRVWLPLIPKP